MEKDKPKQDISISSTSVAVSAHLKITDKTTNKEILNKRG